MSRPVEKIQCPAAVCQNVPGSRKSRLRPPTMRNSQIPREKPVSARQNRFSIRGAPLRKRILRIQEQKPRGLVVENLRETGPRIKHRRGQAGKETDLPCHAPRAAVQYRHELDAPLPARQSLQFGINIRGQPCWPPVPLGLPRLIPPPRLPSALIQLGWTAASLAADGDSIGRPSLAPAPELPR